MILIAPLVPPRFCLQRPLGEEEEEREKRWCGKEGGGKERGGKERRRE